MNSEAVSSPLQPGSGFAFPPDPSSSAAKGGTESLLIGIDFGTTFSGVAWAWSGDLSDVHMVKGWKTTLHMTSDNSKTPTEICYKGNEITWGYGIEPEDEPLRWFKLLLLEEEDLQDDVRNSQQLKRTRSMLGNLKKSAVEVVADYLRLLWKHSIETIERERGKGAVAGLPFKVALTIPAIWEQYPYTQARMREAARKAGILAKRDVGPTAFQLVSEPEAAALATLADFKNRSDIQEGDIFIVCDAGGGTVDIISYKLTQVKPLVLKECVEGEGKLCGAIFIDEAFKNVIRNRMGLQKWSALTRESIKRMMNQEWEHGIKRLYDDSIPQKTWTVTLPYEATPKSGHFGFKNEQKKEGRHEIPIFGNQMKLSRGHIRRIFANVFSQIEQLIDRQVKAVRKKENKNPKAVLLVGGLGSCNYLYQELSQEQSALGIEVLQPSGAKPWTAICRGAIITAAHNRVESRISRLHYGTDFYTTVINDTHKDEDIIWDNEEAAWVATNQMRWYLHKGANVLKQERVKFEWSRICRERLKNDSFKIDLFMCSSETAPSRIEGKVKRLCGITCHLPIPFEDLPEFVNRRGEKLRMVKFSVEMIPTGASLEFVVRINGKRQGQENVTVDF